MALVEEPPPFQDAASCAFCGCSFTTFNRRHHCRCCGKTVCADHSAHHKPLPQYGLNFNVRICDGCHSDERKRAETTVSSNGPLLTSAASSSSSAPSGKDPSKSAVESAPPAVIPCTCGMPLCICQAEETPAPQPARIPTPLPLPLQPPSTGGRGKRAEASSHQSATPCARGPSPSLFSGGGGEKAYEGSGEGLREAVKLGNAAAVKTLLQKGVDPNFVDKQGMSLLHLAAVFNSSEIASMLMEAGASLKTKNSQGETPLDCAPATLAHKMRQLAIQ